MTIIPPEDEGVDTKNLIPEKVQEIKETLSMGVKNILHLGIWILISVIFFVSAPASAANHYIRAGATGSNNGSSWANAWTTFAAVTWTRGDTYYVAGGTYTENVSIPSLSGTSWIIVKKANVTDNGSDAGWDASYASTQAVIQGELTSSASYLEINGVTGGNGITEASATYGIYIYNSNLSYPVVYASGTSFIYLHYIDIEGAGYTEPSSQDGFYWNNPSNQKGLHLAHCWIHNVSRNGVTLSNAVGTSWSDYSLLFENNLLSETGGVTNPDDHGQGMQWYGGTDQYTVIRNNVFRNITGTASIAFLG
ncbi:MAG TPA: hypothetical protein VEF33_06395, partial [Syntrophales bacterium]|nr:hypothetical protein [Syntrophales bacterium]